MPHFDPKSSTTNDVVRHVVIPRSRDGDVGLSFAEKFKPAKVSREPRRGKKHCRLLQAELGWVIYSEIMS